MNVTELTIKSTHRDHVITGPPLLPRTRMNRWPASGWMTDEEKLAETLTEKIFSVQQWRRKGLSCVFSCLQTQSATVWILGASVGTVGLRERLSGTRELLTWEHNDAKLLLLPPGHLVLLDSRIKVTKFHSPEILFLTKKCTCNWFNKYK